MKKGKRIRHALHNEKVCKLINEAGEYPDWVITTAFYAAIHFVSFKIFPIDIQNDAGHNVGLKTLDEYHRHNQLSISKHHALADLVNQHFPEISGEYDWLMDLCNTSRYQNYQQSKVDSDRALKLLEKIKTHLQITDNVSD